MATFEETEQDFSRLPDLPAEVFTAPLKKPDHVGDDWLEPQQTQYDSDDDAIWNDLFERQMGVLPGRAASAFMAGRQKLNRNQDRTTSCRGRDRKCVVAGTGKKQTDHANNEQKT